MDTKYLTKKSFRNESSPVHRDTPAQAGKNPRISNQGKKLPETRFSIPPFKSVVHEKPIRVDRFYHVEHASQSSQVSLTRASIAALLREIVNAEQSQAPSSTAANEHLRRRN